MKSKVAKVLFLIGLVLILFSSCRSKTCSGMKYHNSDVKRGLAH